MRFTRGARAKLTEIEVVLNQWDHTGQQQPLLPLSKLVRFHAGRAEQNRDPLVLCECLPTISHFIQIDMGHLNGGQLPDADRIDLFVFLHVLIFQLQNTPNAAAKQTVKLLHILRQQWDALDAQVGELRLVPIFLDIQMRRDAVNHRICTAFPQDGQRLLCLVRAHIVLRQNALNVIYAFLNNLRIIAGAILTQQKLQHVHRHIRAFLDGLCQVFANDASIKVGTQPLIHGLLRHLSGNITLHILILGHLASLHIRIQSHLQRPSP